MQAKFESHVVITVYDNEGGQDICTTHMTADTRGLHFTAKHRGYEIHEHSINWAALGAGKLYELAAEFLLDLAVRLIEIEPTVIPVVGENRAVVAVSYEPVSESITLTLDDGTEYDFADVDLEGYLDGWYPELIWSIGVAVDAVMEADAIKEFSAA